MSAEHGSAPVAARVRRLEQRLIEAGVLTDDQLDREIERYLAASAPVNGARLVARAWSDGAFGQLLLADAHAAMGEMGMAGLISDESQLRVVANTPTRHNVIVCTLCSCYPLSLLGPSPGWYKSEAYRSRVVREPRAVLAEFGLRLPETTEISVWDASAAARYMVLPCRPAGTADLGQDELTRLVTRNGLIGTAAV